MPIPSQNEFLLPFLRLLGDGHSLTRADIMSWLIRHFAISEDSS